VKEIRKKISIVLVLMIALSLSIISVSAYSKEVPTPYNYPATQTYGTWDSTNERATEAIFGFAFRCQIMFEYTSISTSADEYKIQIDYNGEYPGYPVESLCVYYRWGTTGNWIWICNLDYTLFDGFITIGAATSSTCQILFLDGVQLFDAYQHTWYFGNEPVVWAYWN
jgi:hypothetical protein